VEHKGEVGGDVIVDELLLVVELLASVGLGDDEVVWELLLGVELEPLVEVTLGLLGELDDVIVEVTVALTAVHGVVGFALAHAQRELAAPRTLPAETPHAFSTQFKAADWIAED
jgi:hypothetical protein